MKESDVEKIVVDWAKGHKIATIKLASPHDRGKPDRAFFWGGKTVFIEFKAPGSKPTALQKKWLATFVELGFSATWFDDPAKAIQFLDDLLLPAK